MELDEWFVKEIDRVAMREEIIGSDEYLAALGVVEGPRAPGHASTRSSSEVVAEIEAEWRPGRGQAKEGTE